MGRLPDIGTWSYVIRSRNVYMSIILQSFASAQGAPTATMRRPSTAATRCHRGKSVDAEDDSRDRGGRGQRAEREPQQRRLTTTNTSYIERDLMQALSWPHGQGRALVLFNNAAPLRGQVPHAEAPG
ncbi:MAG: hypothetical protein ACLTMP_09350 [Eggerthella lenta]